MRGASGGRREVARRPLMVWGRSGRRVARRGAPRGGAAQGGGHWRGAARRPALLRRGSPGPARAPKQARGYGGADGRDGAAQVEAASGGGVGAGRSALSSARRPGVLCVGEEGRRRKKEEGGGKKKKRKRKRKRRRKGERERGKERERDAAGFAAAVDARARRLQSEATRTWNEEKGNTRTGIEFGCRIGGSSEKDFGESGAQIGKNFEMI